MDDFLYWPRRFERDEDGQDLIEWALLAAFISIVLLTLLLQFDAPLNALYQYVLDTLTEMAGTL